MPASIPPTRESRLLFALVGGSLIFIGMLVSGCGEGPMVAQSAAAQQTQPVEVRTVRPERRAVQRGIDVTGTLFGDDHVRVAAKVPGRVVAVRKDIGDQVAPGELIALVDRTDFELTRIQREAALGEALSRLGLDAMPGEGFDLTTLPAVRRAQAEEGNARSRLERGRQLFHNDPALISEQEYADLQTAVEVALRNVSVEMLAGRALLGMARSRAADLVVAEQALRDTEIRAPNGASESAGYAVAQRLISMGEWVSAGQTVFALIDADPIKFRVEVPERYASTVRAGQQVGIHVEAYPQPFIGVVTRIAPSIDAASRTFLVEAEVPNADGRLKPGGFARGRIDTSLQERVAFVPASAVVSFAGVKRIFTVSEGKAVEHRVQTGMEIDGRVEIIDANLADDAQVIIEGVTRVSNGAAVQMISRADAAAAPQPPPSEDSRTGETQDHAGAADERRMVN